MIKKMFKVTVALVCMGGMYLFTRSSQSQPLTDLTKANIEALAQGEVYVGVPCALICANCWCIYFDPYEEIQGQPYV